MTMLDALIPNQLKIKFNIADLDILNLGCIEVYEYYLHSRSDLTEHSDGAQYCEGLFGHFLLPNGRQDHLYFPI